jgi:hypothetical protein
MARDRRKKCIVFFTFYDFLTVKIGLQQKKKSKCPAREKYFQYISYMYDESKNQTVQFKCCMLNASAKRAHHSIFNR